MCWPLRCLHEWCDWWRGFSFTFIRAPAENNSQQNKRNSIRNLWPGLGCLSACGHSTRKYPYRFLYTLCCYNNNKDKTRGAWDKLDMEFRTAPRRASARKFVSPVFLFLFFFIYDYSFSLLLSFWMCYCCLDAAIKITTTDRTALLLKGRASSAAYK